MVDIFYINDIIFFFKKYFLKMYYCIFIKQIKLLKNKKFSKKLMRKKSEIEEEKETQILNSQIHYGIVKLLSVLRTQHSHSAKNGGKFIYRQDHYTFVLLIQFILIFFLDVITLLS